MSYKTLGSLGNKGASAVTSYGRIGILTRLPGAATPSARLSETTRIL